MTIAKLIKELQKAEKELGPRHRVSVDIKKFKDLDVDWDYHYVSKIEIVHGIWRYESNDQKEHSSVVIK